MNINDFIKKVKECKKSALLTGFYKTRVQVNKERNELILSHSECCKYCKHEVDKKVKVDFFNPQINLSIFQADMLFSIFGLNKLPIDYAQYHRCIAGKEFIENIKNIGG